MVTLWIIAPIYVWFLVRQIIVDMADVDTNSHYIAGFLFCVFLQSNMISFSNHLSLGTMSKIDIVFLFFSSFVFLIRPVSLRAIVHMLLNLQKIKFS